MARVFDLTSGKESDDEHGLAGDVSTGTTRKRAKIKPSLLEKAWVRTVVTAGLAIVVVASVAFLIYYLRPKGNRTGSGSNNGSAQIIGGKTADDLGPPLKDSVPSDSSR